MIFICVMVKEFGFCGICVNVLCCGMIVICFYDEFIKLEVCIVVVGNILLCCQGCLQEVVDIVVYLVLDVVGFIIGVNVDVNGGIYFF